MAQNIGSFDVTVLPDLRLFREKLQAEAKALRVEVPVELEVSTAEVKRLKQKVEAATRAMRPDVSVGLDLKKSDLAKIRAEMAALSKIANISVLDNERLAVAKRDLKLTLDSIDKIAKSGKDQLALERKLQAARRQALAISAKQISLDENQLRLKQQWIDAGRRLDDRLNSTLEKQSRLRQQWIDAGRRLDSQLAAQARAIERNLDRQLELRQRWADASRRIDDSLARNLDRQATLRQRWIEAGRRFDEQLQRTIDAEYAARNARIISGLNSVRTSLRGIRNDMASFEAFVGRAIRRIALGFSVITIAATAAFGVVATAGIAAYAKVEDAANRASLVFTTSDIAAQAAQGIQHTQEQVLTMNREIRAQLIATAREVGIQTTFNAAQVSSGFEALAQAGLGVQESLDGIGTVARLAQAGAMDLSTTSDLLVQGFLAAGFQAEQFGSQIGELADHLVFVADESAQSLEEVLVGFQNGAGAAAAAYGQTAEEALNILRLLGDTGIAGAEAGTQTSILIREIFRAPHKTEEAAAAWRKYGLSLTDAAGNSRSAAEIIDDITLLFREQTDEFKKGERLAILKKELGFTEKSFRSLQQIFGRVAGLQRQGGGAAAALAQLQNQSMGRLERRSRLALDSLTQRFEAFKETIFSLLSVFGAPAAKVLSAFFDRINGEGTNMGKLFDTLEQKALRWGQSFARVLDSFLRKLEGPEGKRFFSDLTQGMKDLLAGVQLFFSEFAKGFSTGEEEQLSFIETLGIMARAFGELAREILPVVGRSLGEIAGFIREHPELFKNLAKAIIALWAAVKLLRLVILPLVSIFTNLYNAGATLLPIIGRIAFGIGNLGSKSKDVGIKLMAIRDSFSGIARGTGTLKGILPGLGAVFASVAGAAKTLAGALSILARAILISLIPAIATMVRTIVAGLYAITVAFVTNPIGAIITAIVVIIAGAAFLIWKHWDSIKKAFKDSIEIINLGWQLAKERIANLALAFAQKYIEIRNKTVQIKDSIVDGWNDAIDFIKSLPNRVAEKISAIGNAIKEFPGKMYRKAKEIGKAILDGIIDGIKGLPGDLKDAADGLADSVMDNLKGAFDISSPSGLARDQIGYPIAQGVAQGISNGTPEAVAAAQRMARQIVNALRGGIPGVVSLGQSQDKIREVTEKDGRVLVASWKKAIRGVILETESAGAKTSVVIKRSWKSARETISVESAKTGLKVASWIMPPELQGVLSVRGASAGKTAGEAVRGGILGTLQGWENTITEGIENTKPKIHSVVVKTFQTARSGIRVESAKTKNEMPYWLMPTDLQENLNLRGLRIGTSAGQSLANSTGNAVQTTSAAQREKVSAAAQRLFQSFKTSFLQFKNSIVTGIKQIATFFTDRLSLGKKMRDIRRDVEDLQKTMISIRRAANIVVRALRTSIGRQAPALARALADMVLDLGQVAIRNVRLITPTLGEAGKSLVRAMVNGITAGVTANAEVVRSQAIRLVTAFRNGLTSGARTVVYPAAIGIGLRTGNLLAVGVINAFFSGTKVMQGFYNGLNLVYTTQVQPLITSIADWIREHKGPISYDQTLLRPAGVAIMSGFKEGLQDGFHEIKGFISDVGPWVKDFVDQDAFFERSATFLIGNAKVDGDFAPDKFFDDLIPDFPLGLHPTVSLADTTAMANMIAKFYGAKISSLYRNYDTVAGSGVSQHMLGQAADFVGAASTLDRMARDLSMLIDKVFKQIIWRNTLWRGGKGGYGNVGGHTDHLHAGWVPAPGFSLSGKRAQGGPVIPRRAYAVGERGPEVFIPETRGTIVSNKDIKELIEFFRTASAQEKKRFVEQGGAPQFIFNISSNSTDPAAVAAQVDARVRSSLYKVKR